MFQIQVYNEYTYHKQLHHRVTFYTMFHTLNEIKKIQHVGYTLYTYSKDVGVAPSSLPYSAKNIISTSIEPLFSN